MKILVTGAAGFIGSNLAATLAKRGDHVVGIDNFTTYYNPALKYARLSHLCGIETDPAWPITSAIPETTADGQPVRFPEMPYNLQITSSKYPNLKFARIDICDQDSLARLFADEKFDCVMNLAAQAGVRYSLKDPMAYVQTNIVGFMNILNCCKAHDIKHLVYASSSSVYGLNDKVPFDESDNVDRPVSIYAATKKSGELMAHAFGKLYNLPCTALRYFTVYGPWGRPDMAPILFANAITDGHAINVFNNGDLIRDFTYIDDIVNGTIKVIDNPPAPNADGVPVNVFNIGCSHPVKLMDFISTMEKHLGITAFKNFMPMQSGDVYQTNASTKKLEKEVGYAPSTTLNDGLAQFIAWYKSFYLPHIK